MKHSSGPRTGRPPTVATRGMVATSHTLASASGHYALRRGGSAVDAAIAANATLCVLYPHMAGLGGDGFWLIADPAEGYRVNALNASGPAAAEATIDFYRRQGHRDEIPSRGALSALTVPGAVDGWWEAHQRYGKLDWDELFVDAIYYAQNGFPAANSLVDWTVKDRDLLRNYPSAERIYMPSGEPPRAGERLVNPALAGSLQRLAESGPRQGFYEGETAARICKALGDLGSPLREEDFASFHSQWVDPLSVDYRGYIAYEFPPNTQGFAALQVLNLIEGYDLRSFGDNSADYFHHMAEAVKLAFADRNAWLTDPEFLDIPLGRLLDKAYAGERRKLIDSRQAMVMEDVLPGLKPGGDFSGQSGHGGDTCYFCAVDSDGLAVSVIQSIYHDYGSVEIAGDTGIILQNRGSFFSLEENHPNRLEPGKRTFHTLIPAMLYREGKPYLVYGSMGGEGQPQTHAAMVSRIVDFGYDVQQAIEAPRWLMGRTWGTKVQDLAMEGRISDLVYNELKRRGQPVKPVDDWNDNMGHAQAIRLNSETGFLEGGADPRGDGAAIGY